MRTPVVLVGVLVSIIVPACAEPGGGGSVSLGTSAAPLRSSAPAAPTSTATAEQAAAAAPDDLDAAALKKALKCATDAKSGPCAVLVGLGSCTAWNPVSPSGDARWIGRGYRVEGNKTSEEFTLLRSRRVPSNEAGPGQLPVKVGIADLPKEEEAAFTQADRVIKALERHDVPPKGSASIEHLKRRESWPEGLAMRTAGGQVYVASQGGAFVCQGPKQQLLLVQRAATRGGQGDGLYAELWSATW